MKSASGATNPRHSGIKIVLLGEAYNSDVLLFVCLLLPSILFTVVHPAFSR